MNCIMFIASEFRIEKPYVILFMKRELQKEMRRRGRNVCVETSNALLFGVSFKEFYFIKAEQALGLVQIDWEQVRVEKHFLDRGTTFL